MIGSSQNPSLRHPNATKPATKLENSAPPWGIKNPKPQSSTLTSNNQKVSLAKVVRSRLKLKNQLFPPLFSNANMVGAVLGKSGEIKHYIEFSTGCNLDIDRKEGTVKISGKSVDVVEKAKVLVWDKMSAFTFSVNIHNGVAEKILGIKCETLRIIREDT